MTYPPRDLIVPAQFAAAHLGAQAPSGMLPVPFVMIQGPPGTGKTHTVKGVLNVWHLVRDCPDASAVKRSPAILALHTPVAGACRQGAPRQGVLNVWHLVRESGASWLLLPRTCWQDATPSWASSMCGAWCGTFRQRFPKMRGRDCCVKAAAQHQQDADPQARPQRLAPSRHLLACAGSGCRVRVAVRSLISFSLIFIRKVSAGRPDLAAKPGGAL